MAREPVTTRATALRALEVRRNESLVLAEAGLHGERRSSLVRLVMIAMFIVAMEILPHLRGEARAFDLPRFIGGVLFTIWAIGQYVAVHRARPDVRLSWVMPMVSITVDFAFTAYMAWRGFVLYGRVLPEMTAMSSALLLTFSVTRVSLIHIGYATAWAIAAYVSIAARDPHGFPTSGPFVVFGLLAEGVLIAMTNRYVHRMFGDLRRRDNLTRFLPAPVAERLLREGREALAPIQREVTVLFSDIRGFTAMSERMPPREVLAFLDEYFGHMAQIVKGHDGVVGKFLGDGLLAFWGVPDRDPSHAEKAVRAARDMGRVVGELNAARAARGEPPIAIGVGVHTGPVAAGMLGGPDQHEYTVIGDAVNVASRVEGLTKELGASLLVSQSAQALCADRFAWRRVGEATIRGRSEPVVLYTVVE